MAAFEEELDRVEFGTERVEERVKVERTKQSKKSSRCSSAKRKERTSVAKSQPIDC